MLVRGIVRSPSCFEFFRVSRILFFQFFRMCGIEYSFPYTLFFPRFLQICIVVFFVLIFKFLRIIGAQLSFLSSYLFWIRCASICLVTCSAQFALRSAPQGASLTFREKFQRFFNAALSTDFGLHETPLIRAMWCDVGLRPGKSRPDLCAAVAATRHIKYTINHVSRLEITA